MNNFNLVDLLKMILKPVIIAVVVFFIFTGLYYSVAGRDPSTEDQWLLALFSAGLLFIGYNLTSWLYDLIKMLNIKSGGKSKANEQFNLKSIADGNGQVEYVNKNLGYKYLTNVDYITACNERVKGDNLQSHQHIFIYKYNYSRDLIKIIELIDKREDKNIRRRERWEKLKWKKMIGKSKVKMIFLKERKQYAKDLMLEIKAINDIDTLELMGPKFKKFRFKFKIKNKYIKQSHLLSFSTESLDLNEKLNGNILFRGYMDWGRVFIPTLMISVFYLYYSLVKEAFIDETLQQGVNVILMSLAIGTPFSIIWAFTGRFKNRYLTPTEDLSLFYNEYMNTLPIEKE